MKNLISYILILISLSIFIPIKNAEAGVLSRPPTNLGLVGYWPMDEGVGGSAGDFSGQRNNGTITGATWANGKHGKALSFDGNDYVNAGTSDTLNMTGDFSASLWFKTPGPGLNSWDALMSKSNGAYYVNDPNKGWHIISRNISGTNYIFFQYSGASADGTISWVGGADNLWHHVIVTRQSNLFSIYIDGKYANSGTTVVGDVSLPSESLFIGKGRFSDYFHGSLDDVRLYNRALSVTEIANSYKAGSLKIVSSNSAQGVQPVDETLPANAAVGLIRENCSGYSYCATSLSAWQTMMLGGSGPIDWTGCTAGDLVCKNKIAVAKIDGSWSGADTTSTTIDGWVTDSTHYIKIYTTAQARHTGTRSATKYRLEAANVWNPALYLIEDFVYVDGLAVKMTNADGRAILWNPSGASARLYLSNSILYDCTGTGFMSFAGTAVLTNIITMNNGGHGVNSYAMGAPIIYAYNSTAINNGGDGFFASAYRTIICKNCYSGGNAGGDYVNESGLGSLTVTSSYSSDGTLGTTKIPLSTTAGTQFTNVTPGSENLHIKSMSALKDKGTNLSSDPYWVNASGNTDIDRQIRGAGNSPWDVGADENFGRMQIDMSPTNKLTNGLVGNWTMNGKDYNSASTTAEVLDRSGQGNNGNNSGAVPVIGKLGQALNFNSSIPSYVTVGNPTSLQLTTELSICAWIYPKSLSKFIVAKSNGTAARDYGFYVAGSRVLNFYYNGGNVSSSPNTVPLNAWSHACVTVSGSNATFYINGGSPITAGGVSLTNSNYQFAIGRDGSGGGFDWNGFLDEVRIYNRALSADEIKQLYNMGK